MSVLMVMLAALFFSAPFLTHSVWQELHRHETAQIALDNQGIRVGRALRSLKEVQLFEEATVRRLEQEHHRLHQCGLECLAADRGLEFRLEIQSQESEAKLLTGWAEVLDLLSDASAEFDEAFPFERESCKVCLGSWVWKWREEMLPLLLKLSGSASSIPIYLCLPDDGKPQYWMFAGELSAQRFCRL